MVFGKLTRLLRGAVPSAPQLPGADAPADGKDYPIDAALRDHFAPVLRRHGFKGSGRHFRRVSGTVFEAVNVQGALGGGRFAVNLGLHPLEVGDLHGVPLDPAKAKEIDCDFRRRLSETGSDRWWDYFETRASVTEAAKSAAAVFESHGLPLFDRLAAADGPLFTMTPEQFERDDGPLLEGFTFTMPRLMLLLARLRKVQGRLEESRGFARLGLKPGGAEREAPHWLGTDDLRALATEQP